MDSKSQVQHADSSSRAAGPYMCPNCSQGRMKTFYEVRDIPVHSVLLMRSQEQALNYPRRDLQLGFCPWCGFISNVLFDPSVHEYSTSYEETQGFSPTFNAFARNLAQRWVDEYGLRGKTVLEIGCGKGEFLALLVELGVAKGIGIDPAFVPERLRAPAGGRLEFVQDFYGEKYAHLQADAICCRHTLEHIAPTGEFMQTIRRTIGSRRDTLLLFEVPDMSRILNEAAFWDIYYEHCSYFTTGSIARLLGHTGFKVLELEREYDNQYIVLTGMPVTPADAQPVPEKGDVDAVAKAVAEFPNRFSTAKNYWLTLLKELQSEGKSVVLWGGGSKAVSFLTTLGLTDQVRYAVDVNPYKHGKFIPGTGHAVKSPEVLKADQPDCVIVMNRVYVEEVRGMLAKMGLKPDVLAVDDGPPEGFINESGSNYTSTISAATPSACS